VPDKPQLAEMEAGACDVSDVWDRLQQQFTVDDNTEIADTVRRMYTGAREE